MALINCSECGKEISDKAKNCPHCGAPIGSLTNETPSELEKIGKIANELKDKSFDVFSQSTNKISDKISLFLKENASLLTRLAVALGIVYVIFLCVIIANKKPTCVEYFCSKPLAERHEWRKQWWYKEGYYQGRGALSHSLPFSYIGNLIDEFQHTLQGTYQDDACSGGCLYCKDDPKFSDSSNNKELYQAFYQGYEKGYNEVREMH